MLSVKWFTILYRIFCLLFSHSIQLNSKVSAELFVSASGLWMSIACMYVYSYFATKVTSQIQAIGDKVYAIQWHYIPLKLRLFVQLTINRSHRPLYFHGFGLVHCNMATFAKVYFTGFFFWSTNFSLFRICHFIFLSDFFSCVLCFMI